MALLHGNTTNDLRRPDQNIRNSRTKSGENPVVQGNTRLFCTDRSHHVASLCYLTYIHLVVYHMRREWRGLTRAQLRSTTDVNTGLDLFYVLVLSLSAEGPQDSRVPSSHVLPLLTEVVR